MAPKKEVVPAKTKHQEIQEVFAQMEVEAPKIYEKGNKAAGVRYRSCLSKLKTLSTAARAETITLANN